MASTAAPPRAVRAAGARLPRLPRVRARPVAQHARGLPRRPAPVRRLPAPSTPTTRWRVGHARARRLPDRARASARRSARRSPRRRSSARPPACARSTATCAARATISHDPTAELRGPRKTQKLPEVLSRDEVNRLLARAAAAPRRRRCATARCSSCSTPAACAPPRRSGSQLEDVDLEEEFLRARGKGSKERLVPIGREAVARAARLPRRAARPALVGLRPERHVFVNRRGGGAQPPGPLQDRPGLRRGGRPARTA